MGTELTGRAFTTAIAPVMTHATFAFVASVRLLGPKMDQRIAAKLLCQAPNLSLGTQPQGRGALG